MEWIEAGDSVEGVESVKKPNKSEIEEHRLISPLYVLYGWM